MTELGEIAIGEVKEREGFNPRRGVDLEGDGLKKSIETYGILSPILVAKGEDGTFVVSGHRRLAAARALKLEVVPVRFVDPERETEIAVSDNLHREDLTLIEEASAAATLQERGYKTNVAIAKALSVSKERARAYQSVLKLPDSVRDELHSGARGRFTFDQLDQLSKLADVGEAFILNVFELAVSHEREYDESLNEWVATIDGRPWNVESILRGWPDLFTRSSHYDGSTNVWDESPTQYMLPDRRYRLANLPWLEPSEEMAKLEAEILAQDSFDPRSVILEGDLLDRAVGFGAVKLAPAIRRYSSGDDDQGVVVDQAWVKEHLEEILRASLKREKAEAKRRESYATSGGGGGAAAQESIANEAKRTGKEEKEIRKARAEVREAERDRTIAAHDANLELGKQIAERLTLTEKQAVEVLDALIKMAFFGDVGKGAAMAGIRYTHPNLHTEATLKSGKRKIVHTDNKEGEATAAFWRALDQGATLEEKLTAVAGAMAGAMLVDETTAPASRQSSWFPPGHWTNTEPATGVRKIAEAAAKKLTPKVKKFALANLKRKK